MLPLFNTDSYKLSHKGFMNEGTEIIYSNFTARSDKFLPVIPERYDGKYVVFGIQYFILDYIIDEWNREFFGREKHEAIDEFKEEIDAYLGKDSVSMKHFEELHDLGFLPIRIKAIAEGSRVNIRVPFLTIRNTLPEFAWLTNYLETVISCELWKPITTATIIYEYRKLVEEYAMKTMGTTAGTELQVHGFEFRGMCGRVDAGINGAAFLTSSCGTDTVRAIPTIRKYYNTTCKDTFIGTSVPATEHAIACLGTEVEGELESYRKWITEDYPDGVVSLVSDTYDYFKVLTEYLPELKDDILARPEDALGLSKVVIRPDSGDPVKIICGDPNAPKDSPEYKGSVEILWDEFGGEISEQGYKMLDSHIGLIYGDSITLERAQSILEGLERKGFASNSIIFGVGSFTMQYLTRDSLGMAIKATYAEVDGVGYALSKDPVTDSGVKKSARGLLKVEKDGDDYVLRENVSPEEESEGELETVFWNGKLCRETTFMEIRERLHPKK